MHISRTPLISSSLPNSVSSLAFLFFQDFRLKRKGRKRNIARERAQLQQQQPISPAHLQQATSLTPSNPAHQHRSSVHRLLPVRQDIQSLHVASLVDLTAAAAPFLLYNPAPTLGFPPCFVIPSSASSRRQGKLPTPLPSPSPSS